VSWWLWLLTALWACGLIVCAGAAVTLARKNGKQLVAHRIALAIAIGVAWPVVILLGMLWGLGRRIAESTKEKP
jgi:hypothetical protein